MRDINLFVILVFRFQQIVVFTLLDAKFSTKFIVQYLIKNLVRNLFYKISLKI